MKTSNNPVLKGAVLAGVIALCFSFNHSAAGTISHSLSSVIAVSDTGKMKKIDTMQKKGMGMKKMKMDKMKKSNMKPSKKDTDKM